MRSDVDLVRRSLLLSERVWIIVCFISVLSGNNCVIISSVINRFIRPLTWNDRSVSLVLNSSLLIRLLQMALAHSQDAIIVRAIVNTLRPWSSPSVAPHCNIRLF